MSDRSDSPPICEDCESRTGGSVHLVGSPFPSVQASQVAYDGGIPSDLEQFVFEHDESGGIDDSPKDG